MTDRNDITRELMAQAMSDPATSMDYPPLDAGHLIDTGAIRITHPGDGKGGYETNDNPEDFSLVTHWNDLQPDSVTPSWPNKPESYAAARRALSDPSSGALYNGKYRQILWSMSKRGVDDGMNYGMDDQ